MGIKGEIKTFEEVIHQIKADFESVAASTGALIEKAEKGGHIKRNELEAMTSDISLKLEKRDQKTQRINKGLEALKQIEKKRRPLSNQIALKKKSVQELQKQKENLAKAIGEMARAISEAENTEEVVEAPKPKPKPRRKRKPRTQWIVYRNRRSEQLWVYCNTCDPDQQNPLHECLPCDGYICDNCKRTIRMRDARRIAR